MLQRIHVMVVTYKEPVETVECTLMHILAAPVPPYAVKYVYVGDDGALFEEGKAKRAMVERLQEAGACSFTPAFDTFILLFVTFTMIFVTVVP